MSKLLDVHLLGAFNIVYDKQPLAAFQADRPQALLAFLLLHRQTPQPRRHLAFLLWPDSTESQALNNLRNLLHTVRRALPNADEYLAVDSLTLQWRSDAPFSLDVADFEQALAAAQHTADPAAVRRCLEQAMALYQGDLLPANYDNWLIPLREELTRRYQTALLQLVGLLEETGDYQTAVSYGERLVQLDPLNESGVVRLMRLYALVGDRSAIRRVYQNCVTMLAQELDIEPASTTQAAYEELLSQAVVSEPWASIQPSSRQLSPQPQPLPTPATPFIGREAELHEVSQLLADPHCRLLTITGPGGMGKTRLALQTAVSQQPHFPDGIAYASLRALNSADFLAATIANSLNLALTGKMDTADQLLHFLAPKKMLILLDNFEHLLDGVGLLAAVLAQTTNVKLLVTSRQRLDLQEEWVFELGEFALPAPDMADDLTTNSAVALFAQSARRAANSFRLTPADYPAVVQICRLVGGLPLGIELAASWTRLLSCAEIAREIEQGIDFLTVTTHNMPTQHHNLRAVFDQSWDLLTITEQQSLQALAVFQGGFTRQAAAAVAADLATLSALHNKSLLRRMGTERYSLHELVRQYAAERLRGDEQSWTAVRQQHGRYYLNRLAESEPFLFSDLRGPVFEEVTTNLDNIRTAWEWGLEQGQWTLLNRAARSYATFYELYSWNQEGLRTLTRTVERLRPLAGEEAGDPAARLLLGSMMSSSGWFHFRCGQMTAARTAINKAQTLIRAVVQQAAVDHEDGERALQFSLYQLGMVAYVSGDYAAAQAALNEVMVINRARADDWGMAYAQAILGMVRSAQGQADEGYKLLQDSLTAWRRTGAPRLGVFCLSFFGAVAQALGNYHEAVAALQEGLTLAQTVGDRYGVATFLSSLSALSLAQGNYEQAETAVQHSLSIFNDIGDPWHITQTMALLGRIHLAQNKLAGAEKAFRQALETAVTAHAVPYALEALISLAELYAQTARGPAALALAEQVAAHPASSGAAQTRARELVERLRQAGIEETAVADTSESLQAIASRILTHR
ncbi:MAG: BTAD domain-containing putative transcriptional regulator [Chloroflexota bacterium]